VPTLKHLHKIYDLLALQMQRQLKTLTYVWSTTYYTGPAIAAPTLKYLHKIYDLLALQMQGQLNALPYDLQLIAVIKYLNFLSWDWGLVGFKQILRFIV
jgi:hypothetical protein